MKKFFAVFIMISLTASYITGCGGNQPDLPPAATATSEVQPRSTQDPCSQEVLPETLKPINVIMREFDDASSLAASTPVEEIRPAIAELQRIRREAEQLTVPACMTDLKHYQLNHMNIVIDTMLAFMNGADGNTINQGIQLARKQRELYTIELATLLGLQVVTATPGPTQPEATRNPALPPLSGLDVTNPGPTGVKLRAAPSLEADIIQDMNVGEKTSALGISPDGLWLLVDVPTQTGVTAWVYAELVQLSGDKSTLPVITPMP